MKSNNLIRKINRKRDKANEILIKNEPSIEISQEITNNLLILNGGLLNEINKEQIYTLFSAYGTIKSIIMRRGKSYSFITFMDTISASKALNDLNGQEVNVSLKKPEVRFYLYYVNAVPNNEENFKLGVLPPGLLIFEEYVSEETEQDLLSCIVWDEKDSETLKHRQVKHYGARFDYLTNNVDRSESPIDHLPRECIDLLSRMMEENIITQMPDQLTINQYQPGQGIPSHVDTHSAFEGEIIVISLQSQIVMDFTHPNGESIPVLLKSRSLSVMKGESRYLWSHGITPRHYDVIVYKSPTNGNATAGLTSFKRGVRTSFTFRKIRNSACTCCYITQCDSQCKIKEENFELKISEEEAAKLEAKHVHQVYEKIANHFSDTRYSCWPKVVDFVNSIPVNSLVLDCGCGNGKYLHLRKRDLFLVGCDRSFNLCQICRTKNHEVFAGDVLSLPFRDLYFDAAISIAVIHHLANENRRSEAIKELLRVIRPGGLCLIYVWALEQTRGQVKSKYLKRGPSAKFEDNGSSGPALLNGDNIDEYLLRGEQNTSTKLDDNGELRSDVDAVFRTTMNSLDKGIGLSGRRTMDESSRNLNDDSMNTSKIVADDTELPTHRNRTDFRSQDVFVPWHNKSKTDLRLAGDVEKRYYHVYKVSELVETCRKLSDFATIVDCYYDQGNWCVVLEKF